MGWGVRIALYGTLLLIGAFAGLVTAAFPELPALEGSEELRRMEGKVLARDDTTVLRRLRGPTSRKYALERDISPTLQDAVMAAEDRRFESHVGIDPRAIVRAAWADVRSGELEQGGSTITQQLVKNAYVGPERSAARKTREAMLAVALETQWSKHRILTAYLNVAYFGRGTYGIRDASRLWFHTPPRKLTAAQSAFLAGMLRSPERYDPLRNPKRSAERRDQVLHTMHDMGRLDAAQLRTALHTPLPTRRQVVRNMRKGDEIAPHFTDDVVGDLVQRYGTATALSGGLRVRTTLDARMQRLANRTLRQLNGTGLSAALVTLDIRSGEIRAMAIGGPAAEDAFNVAVDGQRQPGSAFKPFALAAALEDGYTPSSVFLSAPYTTKWNGLTVKITNDSGLYAGPQQLAAATWYSDNTVYARVAEAVGMDSVISMAHRAGIEADATDSPVTVLGALPHGVSALEMANAYRSFAARGEPRGGTGAEPISLLQVNRRGEGVILKQTSGSTRSALPAPVADLVTQTLQGVIARGTGVRAQIDRPAAGKTGTTEGNSDAWFVGYTPQLVTAIWVGHPEGRVSMTSEFAGGPVSGGTWPALLWGKYMQQASAGMKVRQFAVSRLEFVQRRIDPKTRLLADKWCRGSVVERFIKGTEPTAKSTECEQIKRAAPSVQGMPRAQAVAALTKAGFTVDVREVVGPPAQAGLVMAQIPGPSIAASGSDPIKLLVVRPMEPHQ